MNSNELNKMVLEHALDGLYAHVLPSRAVEGLTAALASRKAEGFQHTIFQLIEHMNYWQDIFLKDVYRTHFVKPQHASDGWTANEIPADENELKVSVEKFLMGLQDAKRCAKNIDENAREIDRGDMIVDVYDVLHSLASHNSYHLGQIVTLRHIFGAWPPPSGGMTW